MTSSISANGRPANPSIFARLLVLLAWAFTALMIVCGAMLGPALVVVLPVVFAFGVGMITSAHSNLDR